MKRLKQLLDFLLILIKSDTYLNVLKDDLQWEKSIALIAIDLAGMPQQFTKQFQKISLLLTLPFLNNLFLLLILEPCGSFCSQAGPVPSLSYAAIS